MKKQLGIMAVILVIVIGLGIWLVNKSGTVGTGGDQPANSALLVRADSNQTNPGAKVTLVEFGDYQCPACGAAYPMVKEITDQFKSNKDFNFVFRNFPLPMHPFAPMAAEAAEAAGAQGKYWEMHDLLYANQNTWTVLNNPLDTFVSMRTAIGDFRFSLSRFLACSLHG